MIARIVMVLFMAGCFLAGPAFAQDCCPGGEASKDKGAAGICEKGNVLLRKGDFEGAARAYEAAVKTDGDNPEYSNRLKTVQRVIELRKYIAGNEPSPKWEKIAESLHTYYLRNDIHSEALALDRDVHARLNNALSMSLLAETYLEMDMNNEAFELLKVLTEKDSTPQNRLYLGIALARLGMKDEAGMIADKYPLPENAGIGLIYDAARFYALLGRSNEAVGLLTRLFEKTPPGQLGMVKEYVKKCRDFAPILAYSGFKNALETASKVEASGCGGGGCEKMKKGGGCNMKKEGGSCGSGHSDCKGKQDEKKSGCSGGSCKG